MDKELGKAIPYGVYDATGNQGWVSVGIDHDTGSGSRRRTIRRMVARRWGRRRTTGQTELLITADVVAATAARMPPMEGVLCKNWLTKLGLALQCVSLPAGDEQVE